MLFIHIVLFTRSKYFLLKTIQLLIPLLTHKVILWSSTKKKKKVEVDTGDTEKIQRHPEDYFKSYDPCEEETYRPPMKEFLYMLR